MSHHTPPPGPSDPRVDELRQRLRALGYLDAGVDRFVLRGVRRTRQPAIIALFASIRIGVLAAVLLGPAAAIGLITRVPGLVTGPRDAVIAALYLGMFFGAAAIAASLILALVTTWIAGQSGTGADVLERRARTLSMTAGLLVTTGSFVYLALWWRAASFDGATAAWTLLALAVAAAISLLVGHAVTMTILATTLAKSDQPGWAVRGTGWKAAVAVTAIAFVGAATLLLSTARKTPGTPAPLSVRSSGARVIVLAIDGFDPRLDERVRPPAGASDATSLHRIFDAAHAALTPSDSRDPARLWTTIATGVSPESHGVAGLETRRIAGLQGRLGSGSTAQIVGAASDVLRLTRPAIASNFERRVKTFWEVAEQAGLRAGVVNWWATWPAAATGGVIVSDRAVVRLERGGPLDAEMAPPEIYDLLKERWPQIQASTHLGSVRTLSKDGEFGPLHVSPDVKAVLERSVALDLTVMQIADTIGQGRSLDLLVVYLPGLDIAQQTLLAGEGGAPAPSELEPRISALEGYYRFLHRLTAAAVTGLDDRRVFVITQGGRLHRSEGILAVRGPGMRGAVRVSGAVVDVAPTILHALGVPIARDLHGRVMTELFDSPALAQYPVRSIDTYGGRSSPAVVRGNQPLDQEVIDRLRSLGYVR